MDQEVKVRRMTTIIIAEKPDAARRIAEALSDKKAVKKEKRGAFWFEFTKNGKKHIVVPAVGHASDGSGIIDVAEVVSLNVRQPHSGGYQQYNHQAGACRPVR